MSNKLPVLVLGLFFLASTTAAAAAAPFNGVYGTGPEKFTLATGSPGELGLVKALAQLCGIIGSPSTNPKRRII